MVLSMLRSSAPLLPSVTPWSGDVRNGQPTICRHLRCVRQSALSISAMAFRAADRARVSPPSEVAATSGAVSANLIACASPWVTARAKTSRGVSPSALGARRRARGVRGAQPAGEVRESGVAVQGRQVPLGDPARIAQRLLPVGVGDTGAGNRYVLQPLRVGVEPAVDGPGLAVAGQGFDGHRAVVAQAAPGGGGRGVRLRRGAVVSRVRCPEPGAPGPPCPEPPSPRVPSPVSRARVLAPVSRGHTGQEVSGIGGRVLP